MVLHALVACAALGGVQAAQPIVNAMCRALHQRALQHCVSAPRWRHSSRGGGISSSSRLPCSCCTPSASARTCAHASPAAADVRARTLRAAAHGAAAASTAVALAASAATEVASGGTARRRGCEVGTRRCAQRAPFWAGSKQRSAAALAGPRNQAKATAPRASATQAASGRGALCALAQGRRLHAHGAVRPCSPCNQSGGPRPYPMPTAACGVWV